MARCSGASMPILICRPVPPSSVIWIGPFANSSANVMLASAPSAGWMTMDSSERRLMTNIEQRAAALLESAFEVQELVRYPAGVDLVAAALHRLLHGGHFRCVDDGSAGDGFTQFLQNAGGAGQSHMIGARRSRCRVACSGTSVLVGRRHAAARTLDGRGCIARVESTNFIRHLHLPGCAATPYRLYRHS